MLFFSQFWRVIAEDQGAWVGYWWGLSSQVAVPFCLPMSSLLSRDGRISLAVFVLLRRMLALLL